jgi:hypothetical protein
MAWLTKASVARFLHSDEAILILVRSECPHCARLVAEIEEQLARPDLAGIKVGTLVLDRPGARRFRCDNPWRGGLDVFPYVVRYRHGRRVAAARSSGSVRLVTTAISRFVARLDREAA